MISTAFNLDKVTYMKHGYMNEYGHKRDKLPTHKTYCGTDILVDTIPSNVIVDTWTEYVDVKLSYGEHLVFKGERAKNIWKEWMKETFSKNK